MYSFVDELNGEHLTLRPEATASIVRASIEHSLLYGGPQRVWYMGPMYRHERPQKGRYRQFHQVDVEALGVPGPDVDAELIVMCARLWGDLGLDGLRLHLNSLGSLDERRAHRAALVAYLKRHESELDDDSRRRLRHEPVARARYEESGDAGDRRGEPAADRLSRRRFARTHFEGVQAVLKDAAIPYTIDHAAGAGPRLLQPHRVRVDHRPARRPGHRLRGRPLRRPVRADRRQGVDRRRLRDGGRAPDRTACARAAKPRRARPATPTSSTRARRPTGSRSPSPSGSATTASR